MSGLQRHSPVCKPLSPLDVGAPGLDAGFHGAAPSPGPTELGNPGPLRLPARGPHRARPGHPCEAGHRCPSASSAHKLTLQATLKTSVSRSSCYSWSPKCLRNGPQPRQHPASCHSSGCVRKRPPLPMSLSHAFLYNTDYNPAQHMAPAARPNPRVPG